MVSWVCWFVVGYKQRQMEVRSKYLDDNLTKGLAILFLPLLLTYSALIVCLVFLFIKVNNVIRAGSVTTVLIIAIKKPYTVVGKRQG